MVRSSYCVTLSQDDMLATEPQNTTKLPSLSVIEEE